MAVDNNNRSFALPSRGLTDKMQGVSPLSAGDIKALNQAKPAENQPAFGSNAFDKKSEFDKPNLALKPAG